MAEAEAEEVAGLPPIDAGTGFLPPGIHSCTWDEFEQAFVDGAPNPDHRRRRLRALEVYVDCLDELLPGATLWLDGGFVSHKATPPFDIDVVAVVDPQAWAQVAQAAEAETAAFIDWLNAGQIGYPPKTPTAAQLSGLMTHQGLTHVQRGGFYARIQPFGGRIDSFITPSDAQQTLDNFRRDWMMDIGTGTEKGFVEVTPDAR